MLLKVKEKNVLPIEALNKKVDDFILSMIDDVSTINIKHDIEPKMTWNRFDLAIKMIYLECNDYNKSGYGKECYSEHIKAFSLGTFKERGNDKKSSLNDFFDCFDSLRIDMENNGFSDNKSLIPLAIDGSILNGAHRTSVAMYLNKSISCVETDIEPFCFDYQFFKNRGVSDSILDCAIQQFIKFSSDCYVAIVWPSAKGHSSEIEKLFSSLVYKKNIRLNYNGAHNLLAEAYEGEVWLGNEKQNYPGIKSKLVKCFPCFEDVRVYVFQEKDLESVLEVKEKIRSIFNIEKHSVHITDNKAEALKLSSLLFNDNGVHFLNNAIPTKFNSTKEKMYKFNKFIKLNNVESKDIMLDSGMVLAVYGLREASDIDYLTSLEGFSVEDELVEHHRKELVYHGVEEEELVVNPKYHFVYKGIKFISIPQLKFMKNNRAEIKDKADIQLLEQLSHENKWSIYLNKLKYNYYFTYAKSVICIRMAIIKITKTLGVYDKVKRVYKLMVSR